MTMFAETSRIFHSIWKLEWSKLLGIAWSKTGQMVSPENMDTQYPLILKNP